MNPLQTLKTISSQQSAIVKKAQGAISQLNKDLSPLGYMVVAKGDATKPLTCAYCSRTFQKEGHRRLHVTRAHRGGK